MSHENAADLFAALQAARTKSKCIELLALAADYREVLPQVLELLRQYYAAEQVQFCECGDADAGKPDSIGRLAESEKTNVGGAGNFAASVIFEEKLYGKLLVVHGSAAASDRTLLSDIGRVLASEIGKKQFQEYLLHLSYLDQLTGIRNNTSYIWMLNHLREHPVPVGVAFADLNGLKYLNDTYGHEYGDQAIRHLAEVCMEYFAKDQLYRIGGDEFVVICPEIREEEFTRQAELLKERLKQEEQELAAFAYLWNGGSTGAGQLLHRAERLMYQEKQLHYQDSMRRVQECPGYAETLLKHCGQSAEKREGIRNDARGISDEISFLYLKNK